MYGICKRICMCSCRRVYHVCVSDCVPVTGIPVYVYVYVCLYVCVYVYLCLYVDVYVYVCLYVCLYVCTNVHDWVYV